jgi:hypothetical protein
MDTKGTGHLPAPAHFAGPKEGIRHRRNGKNDLKKQPPDFKGRGQKFFRRE